MYGEGIPLCLALAFGEGSVFKTGAATLGGHVTLSLISTADGMSGHCGRLPLGTGEGLHFKEGLIKNKEHSKSARNDRRRYGLLLGSALHLW